MDNLLQRVQQEAWDGLIPTELSMDSSEVTSLQRPLPLYLLLPRMSYLPCLADTISHHFGEVVPDAQPTLWLEETRSGEPLRWHIPTGVLFDLIAGSGRGKGGGVGLNAAGEGKTAQHDDESAWSSDECSDLLPWRITVHFQGCPRRQVFPLEKEADIRRHYTNALKQALFLQSGSSRAGMTLAKDNQNRLWQSVKTNDGKLYHEMDLLLSGSKGGVRLVPVRLLAGGAPPSQLPIPAKRPDGTPFTLRDCLSWFCPDAPWEQGFEKLEPEEASQEKHEPQEEEVAAAAAAAAAAATQPLRGQLDGRLGGGVPTGAAGSVGRSSEGDGSYAVPLPAAPTDTVGKVEPSTAASVRDYQNSATEGSVNVAAGAIGHGGIGAEGSKGVGVGERERERRIPDGFVGDVGFRDRWPPIVMDRANRGGMALPAVFVQGVEVPLDSPIVQLWDALRHPDHFLYVVVRRH